MTKPFDSVERGEPDAQIHRIADERWSRLLTTGKSIPLDEARAWLEARARGERASKPVARRIRR